MKLTPWEPDLRSLVDRIDIGDIDLQPEFQRQEVWGLTKKKRLIDTVLRAWSIPPVHLVVTTDSRLEVLDGQQRLAAIRDFLNGSFSIDGRITPQDAFVASLHGQFYSKLDSAVRRRIDQYTLRCFRITDYLPEEPSELFYRLNQPTMLTAGEQRNALYGPARAQLKDLVKRFVGAGNHQQTIGFSNARLAYDDIIARLLYFLEIGNFGIKGTESRISERFRSRNGFPGDVVNRAATAISLFSAVRECSEGQRFNKASLLSWLLFFTRFDGNAPDLQIIQAFGESRTSKRVQENLHKAAALFDDRASLRVTDVSSVVYRDVALWFVYFFAISRALPNAIPASEIIALANYLQQRSDASFEQAVTEIIKIDKWGKTL